MKKLIAIVSAVLLQTACAMVPQTDAIQAAIERGQFEGADENSDFYITVPASHSGPYSSVDLINFQTGVGEIKDSDMSAVMAKSRQTGEWEVLVLLTREDGRWTVLQKKLER